MLFRPCLAEKALVFIKKKSWNDSTMPFPVLGPVARKQIGCSSSHGNNHTFRIASTVLFSDPQSSVIAADGEDIEQKTPGQIDQKTDRDRERECLLDGRCDS